jgi:Secretion system C-terminal sorting domain
MKKKALQVFQTAVLCSMLFASSSPAADSTVNYDTAWTYVYDGGTYSDGTHTFDDFYDIKALPDGGYVCAGASGDTTTTIGQLVLMKLNSSGNVSWKRLYKYKYNQYARSIAIAKNGDFIIGGMRYGNPLIFRTDTIGNIKWSTWVYDSVNNRQVLLSRGATVNCVRETSRGTIICAAGDYFTDAGYVYGSTKNNYFAFLELDSTGKIINLGQMSNAAGYNLGGFYIEETQGGNYLISGNQGVVEQDTGAHILWKTAYTFSLAGVGSEVNNVTCCKIIRGNIPIVAGQAYEGNCWIKYSHLFYDAWWSPITLANDGMNATWDTAGFEGGDDRINDFTQLANGNLVFVGKANYSNASTSGIWVYVTPDTGSHILWQGIIAGPLNAGEPLSVCATQDTGFTVVGKVGGNAFAAHFVPGPLSGVKCSRSVVPAAQLSARLVGRRLFVTNANSGTTAHVSLYDVSGKRVAIQKGEKEISLDISNVAKGTYFVQVKNAGAMWAEKIVVQ